MDLSIIVCVYNTPHRFLAECLDSIVGSTLSFLSEWEICLIDDGSREDYTELLSRYGDRIKYKWVENGGMVRARDEGIALAEGKYISFVDSDDTVSINYHLPMLRRAESSGADIIVNDWAFRTDNSRYYLTGDMACGSDFSLDGREALLAFTGQRGREQSLTVLWNKLYSRETLLAASRLLHERCGELSGFNYSEDAIRNFFNFAVANRVENIHTGYYFYRQHSAQSVNAVGEAALENQIDRMSYTLDVMSSYAETLPDSEALLANIGEWRCLMSRTHFSYAREAGYTSLYPKIRECYRVDTLRTATLRDGEIYATVRSLPDNFTEIDGAFLSALGTGAELESIPRRGYSARLAKDLSDMGLMPTKACRTGGEDSVDGASRDEGATTLSLPKEKISLKNRVLHTPLIYKLAMLLFPKGSRLRALLKRKL